MSWFEGIRIEFGVPRASVTTSDRGEHLRQIAENPAFVEYLWRRCIEDRVNVADIAIFMHDFPSFSADIFLKRAFLFFALLDRIYGRAQALARQLPVAADYQLPKVLRAAGVLRYSETLAGTGDSCTAIEAGSREETEIRAGTIIAGARLAMGIGVTETQVDDWLWQARNRVPSPHHRTRICAY